MIELLNIYIYIYIYRLADLFKGFIKPDRQKNIYSKTYLN